MNKNTSEINRRKFLKLSASFAAMLSLPLGLKSSVSDKWGSVLPTRPLGNTGLDVSMFAIGGGALRSDYQTMESIIETAIQQGCRFFETARSYSGGRSEIGFGKYLTPNYRNEITLLSKTRATDGEGLKKELDESLTALKTDHLDIYLIHAVNSIDDLENRLKQGVFDEIVKAKEQGMIKHIGFSGHTHPDINNYFMDKNFPELEVVLMPMNVVDPVQHSFVLNSLPKAIEKNIGVIGMKVFAGGGMFGGEVKWGRNVGEKREALIPDVITKKEAQYFAYSLPIASATIGCQDAFQVKENIENTRSFQELDEVARKQLIERVTEIALNNTIEHYKLR